MITGRSGRQVLGGGGAFPVDVSSLARELRRLWEENAPANAPEGASARPVITRACTRNLVALAGGPEGAKRATRLVAALASLHPTRAFVVEDVADDPARLDAHLQAHCAIRTGGRHVCCEQISLSVGAAARRRAAGTILPLLVPDLPVFVWVLGTPDWDDPLLARLLDVADRMLIDSGLSADPVGLVCGLARANREDSWAPGDFEWSRLASWREAVASLFDEPSTAALPARLEQVRVRYGAGGSTVGAALLAGWALDRIAAARTEEDARPWPQPTAVLEPVEGKAPGAILGVSLTAAAPRAICDVAIEAGDAALMAQVKLGDACPLPARHPFVTLSEEQLLEDQLDLPGASPIYDRALEHAAALLMKGRP